jgi:hypothetical protein
MKAVSSKNSFIHLVIAIIDHKPAINRRPYLMR